MKKVYAMQNKEIARRLDLSVSTVEKHLTKGIRRLNSTITSRYGEQDTLRPLNQKGTN
jgi:DNA-directed RNA polymerase specialized sigma24 family protein